MASRKQIEKYIIDGVNAIDKTGKNGDLYKELFKGMSTKEFEAFGKSLKDGEAFINIVIPPLSDIERGITVESNLKVADKFGVKFFQKLKFEDEGIGSNIKVLVYHGMFRRVKQTTVKSMSVPKDSKGRNTTTNESAGKSKGTRITLPEADILLSHGLKFTMKEFTNVRGGDLGANTAMLSEINKTGKVSQRVTDTFRTGTGAKNIVNSLFMAMHIKTTL